MFIKTGRLFRAGEIFQCLHRCRREKLARHGQQICLRLDRFHIHARRGIQRNHARRQPARVRQVELERRRSGRPADERLALRIAPKLPRARSRRMIPAQYRADQRVRPHKLRAVGGLMKFLRVFTLRVGQHLPDKFFLI